MRSHRKWVVGLVMAMALGAVGCTHQVRPMPKLQGTAGPVLQLRAKYYIAPEERARIHSDTYFALGKANPWNVEIGEALAASFPEALRGVFASVTAAAGPDDMSDADVLLVPAIAQFDISGGSFTSTIQVKVKALGQQRQLAMDEVFNGAPSEGKAGTAWLGGVFGGEAALQRSAEYAFEEVMPKIVAQLRKVYAKQQVPTS